MVGRVDPGLDLEAGLREALTALPVVAPPDVALEEILERGRVRVRRRIAASGILGLILSVGITGMLWMESDRSAPVNLKIQLIDVPEGPSPTVGGRSVREWDLLVDGVPGEVQAP